MAKTERIPPYTLYTLLLQLLSSIMAVCEKTTKTFPTKQEKRKAASGGVRKSEGDGQKFIFLEKHFEKPAGI